MKPYRLINTMELHVLQLHIEQIIQNWNQTYAIEPIQATVSLAPKDYVLNELFVLKLKQQHIVYTEKNYLNLTNIALFTTDKPCFNACSEQLFLKLLQQLIGAESATLHYQQDKVENWFYAGSTCLLVKLECRKISLNLFLNPDWVLQQLPPIRTTTTTLSNLQDALSTQRITMYLELLPIQLPLKQLLDLQIGDVLATDQPIDIPLNLMQKRNIIAQCDFGQSQNYKSIILKRSS